MPADRMDKRRRAASSIVKQEGTRSARLLSVTSSRPTAVLPQHCAVLQGQLVALTSDGEPLVDFSGNEERRALLARSSVDISPQDLGRSVLLVFLDGDARRPAIVGVLRTPKDPSRGSSSGRARRLAITVDNDRLLLSAYREISLECGKASIRLFSDGRVELRGTNVLSRSSAVNRVKGGYVVIN